MVLDIETRTVWNAFPARETAMLTELSFPVNNVFFTYTMTYDCDNTRLCSTILKSLQDKAMRLKYLEDIYYNFLIGGDGKVYEGRGWLHSPLLPLKFASYARKSIYVAFIGKFAEKRPNEIMRKARFDLIQHGLLMGFIEETFSKYDIVMRTDRFKESTRTGHY